MNKGKKIIFAIFFLFLFTNISFLNAVAWSNWAKPDVDYLVKNNIIEIEKLSKPKSKISRKEFAYISVRLYEIFTGKKAQRGDAYFLDTYDNYILMAKNHNIVSGYPDGTFQPENYITRQELAVLYVNLLDSIGKSHFISEYERFSDHEKIGTWALNSVYTCRKYKIIAGMEENQFMPTENATVEQALVMSKRMFDIFSAPEYIEKFEDKKSQSKLQENSHNKKDKDDVKNTKVEKDAEKQNSNQNLSQEKNLNKKSISFEAFTNSDKKYSYTGNTKTLIHFYSSDVNSSLESIKKIMNIKLRNTDYELILIDVAKSANSQIQKIIRDDFQMDYVVDSDRQIYTKYRVKYLPTTVFVDFQGLIKIVLEGNAPLNVYQKYINDISE